MCAAAISKHEYLFHELTLNSIYFSLCVIHLVQANERLDDDEDYLVDHSIVLYLVDKNGEFVDFFTQRAQIGDVVEKIEAHMKT
jgi:cytochrome oxidase Cu insertion factor (SCO1/SenC/PrrC family)